MFTQIYNSVAGKITTTKGTLMEILKSPYLL